MVLTATVFAEVDGSACIGCRHIVYRRGMLTMVKYSIFGLSFVAIAAALSFSHPATSGENSAAQAIDNMRFRQQVVERLTALEAAQKKVAQLEYRVSQLERKTAGVQKQVTVLHAKKADH